MLTDMPLAELRAYRPERVEPSDFDSFWTSTIAEARAAASEPTFTLVETRSIAVDTYDVTFSGYAGQPIRGWLRVPKNLDGPLPAVVDYLGYGGGRGPAFEPTLWSSVGYVHFLMDSRGQGAWWGSADTPDGDIEPQVGGVMTRGIQSPETYYYRRIYTDAVRALDIVRALPSVDASRVAARGGSQGASLAMAAVALGEPTRVASLDVPFMCGIRRSTLLSNIIPFQEINDYLRYRRLDVERVFETLSYFDCVNLAPRATTPAQFSAGLMDATCPPSGPFAAYNYWGADDKDMNVWEYNDHDGGGAFQMERALDFVATRLDAQP